MCYPCAKKVHPEYYKGKRHHGVKPFDGVKNRNIVPFAVESLPDIEENNTRTNSEKIKTPKILEELPNIEN